MYLTITKVRLIVPADAHEDQHDVQCSTDQRLALARRRAAGQSTRLSHGQEWRGEARLLLGPRRGVDARRIVAAACPTSASPTNRTRSIATGVTAIDTATGRSTAGAATMVGAGAAYAFPGHAGAALSADTAALAPRQEHSRSSAWSA